MLNPVIINCFNSIKCSSGTQIQSNWTITKKNVYISSVSSFLAFKTSNAWSALLDFWVVILNWPVRLNLVLYASEYEVYRIALSHCIKFGVLCQSDWLKKCCYGSLAARNINTSPVLYQDTLRGLRWFRQLPSIVSLFEEAIAPPQTVVFGCVLLDLCLSPLQFYIYSNLAW